MRMIGFRFGRLRFRGFVGWNFVCIQQAQVAKRRRYTEENGFNNENVSSPCSCQGSTPLEPCDGIPKLFHVSYTTLR